MLRVEPQLRLDGVTAAGEVIDLLRNVGEEDLEAVGQRDVVVLLFFCRLTRRVRNRLRAGGIPRLGLAQGGHLHVRAHVHMAFHGVHHVSGGFAAFLHSHVGHVVTRHVHSGHALSAAESVGRRGTRCLSPGNAAKQRGGN